MSPVAEQSQTPLPQGFHGRLLRVNLTSRTSRIEPIPRDLFTQFIGGRGLGAYYLYKEVPPTVQPMDPMNKLIFTAGPLMGTPIPGANKCCLTFKSPLTGIYGYSLCGGHWGPELKFAGFDVLIIEGHATDPVYLWIQNDKVEFRSAQAIWGQLIPESDRLIRAELDNDARIQIAVIGPAGEKQVKYACITSGLFREFGRCGGGALMGAKNLKGIALRGTTDVPIADISGIKVVSAELLGNLGRADMAKTRRLYGTPELVSKFNGAGFMLTRNCSEGFFPDGSKVDGPQMRKDIVVGDASCYGCPVACGKRSAVVSTKYGHMLIEGPEFETIALLGSNCGVSDWESLLRATQICDQYGIDTMNAGGCVALVMECFEKGILTLNDTDQIEARFGRGDALVQLLQAIGERKGIGNILAEGIRAAGDAFGAPELAMHSKGQGFGAYDPRGAKGMALTYATSPKGAHHMVATTMGVELGSGSRLKYTGKGALQKQHQISMAVVDSLGLCSTMRCGIPMNDQARAWSVITGIPLQEADLTVMGERIINLERMYNVRLGLNRQHDTLPKRMLTETFTVGQSAGEVVDLPRLLDDFYGVMGWDPTGIPTPTKLDQLGLSRIVN